MRDSTLVKVADMRKSAPHCGMCASAIERNPFEIMFKYAPGREWLPSGKWFATRAEANAYLLSR